MQLPSSNIRRVSAYAMVAGLALGLLTYGFVHAFERTPDATVAHAVIAALLVGGLLGLSMGFAIKLALRHVAIDLYNYAVNLTDSNLQAPSSFNDDEVAYLRGTLRAALASVPRNESFLQLAQELAAAPSLQGAVASAGRQITSHLPVQGTLVLLLDGERNLLYPAADWGQVGIDQNITLDLHETAIGRALQERRIALYSGIQALDLLPMRGGSEAVTLCCLPLLVNGQPFGMLCLISTESEMRLSDEQRAFARAVADILTLAIQSSRQRQLFERESDRLAAFEQLGSLLATSERFDYALEQVLRVAARVTDSEHGSLLLVDPGQTEVRYRITLREGDVLPLNVTAGAILKHGMAGWALRERRADIIDDTERDTRWLPVPGLGDMRSVLVVPLLYGAQALGVLTLADPTPRRYSRRSLALASALAAHAVTILARMQHDEMVGHKDVALARRIFEGHLSPDVVAGLLGDEVAVERVITPQLCSVIALYIGLHGLDRISEQLPADHLLGQIISPYLIEMSTIAHEQQGYIIQRGEDGLLMLFGFPALASDSRIRALRAALAVQAAARRLRGHWRAKVSSELSLSAGLASGEIVAGVVGNEPYRNFTLFGGAEHEARSLQQLARADEVLVSDSLVASLGGESVFQFDVLPPLSRHDSSVYMIYRLVSG